VEVSLLSGCRGCSILPAALRNVSFAADYRIYAATLHRVVKRDRAKHVAVIRHGASRHAKFLGSLRKWLYLNRSVKEAVIGVKMEVNESLIRHIDYETASCLLAISRTEESLTNPAYATIARWLTSLTDVGR
jgi:hypothetical protein